MKVLVFERNLLWSSRLVRSLQGLGHEAALLQEMPEDAGGAEMAIINLSEPDPLGAVSRLHAMGVRVIGHAGHKEKTLLDLGKAAGVDVLATNSELTYKLGELLDRK